MCEEEIGLAGLRLGCKRGKTRLSAPRGGCGEVISKADLPL